MTDTITLGFVCVQNAGRSQMATAFAEAEREKRGLEGTVEIVTGGTHPADSVHDVVLEIMGELGFDLSDRTPQAVSDEELADCDIAATMGCSTLELDADTEIRDWALDDPDGVGTDDARRIRDTVRANVETLFDDVEATLKKQQGTVDRSRSVSND